MELEKIEHGLMEYIKHEIANKADGLTKFLIYTGLNMPNLHITPILENLKDNEIIKMTGVFIDDNHVDLDLLYSAAKQAMNQCHNVTYMGIKFDSSDIDKLYQYISR